MIRIAKLVGLAGARASGEALPCSLFAEVSRQGHFFGFAFFTANFLAPFFALLFESPAAPSPALRPLP
jgi:predicted cobalt transporter CbtA